MNACVAQAMDEGGVFDAAYTVTNAGGLEVLDRFPDALGAACFAGVSGAVQSLLDGVAEGRDVRGDRVASFVAGDVEGSDAGACKLLD